MRVAQSSHLQQYEYDEKTQTLVIQFTNGAIYSYSGVDPNSYFSFAQSASPGQYFHSKIKGKYDTTNIAAGDKQMRRR